MTDYLVANAKELQTALSKASGGDVISLKSGDYGQFDFTGLNFSSQVVIRSADGKQGATFDKITVENCSNLRIDSVHVDYPSNSGQSAVHILDSSRISFVNSEVNGKVDGDYTGPFAGIYVTGDTSGLVIANNDLHHVHRGMVFYGGRDLTVSGNTVDYIGEDAFNFGNIKGGLIENNVGPTHFFPASGAHSDFMQFAGSGSGLVIRGNVMLLEDQFNMQGIFLNNGTFNDVLIEQNLIYTGMMNGIYVSSGAGVVVKNNTLINAPGYASDATIIRLLEGGVVQDNIFTNKTGGTKGSNTIVQYLDPKGDNYIGDLFSNGTTIAPEKLASVLANLGNEGAYKLLEALSSGSYSSLGEYPAPTVDSNSSSDSGLVLTPTTSVASSTPEGATIGIGTTEAESLDLSGGYAVETLSGGTTVIKSSGTGTASGTFTGATGTYWLDVDWLNENDGVSTIKVLVNGAVVESWTGTGGNNSLETTRVGLNLQAGDTISLQGIKNEGEYARIDKIALSEQGGNNTTQIDGANTSLVSTPTTSVASSTPEAATIGLGTTEAESLDLSGGYAVETLSGGTTVIKSSGTGTASGTFTGATGTYWLDVDWFNENDGVSTIKVLVNGAVVDSWTGTGGNNSWRRPGSVSIFRLAIRSPCRGSRTWANMPGSTR